MIDMIFTTVTDDGGHILGLDPHTAGHLSVTVTDRTLPMTRDMTTLMITTTEGTDTGQFHEVSHPRQGEDQGGVTPGVSPLFEGGGAIHEVSPPGAAGGAPYEVFLPQERVLGVIQEALKGVAGIPNGGTQEAQVEVLVQVQDHFQGPTLLDPHRLRLNYCCLRLTYYVLVIIGVGRYM